MENSRNHIWRPRDAAVVGMICYESSILVATAAGVYVISGEAPLPSNEIGVENLTFDGRSLKLSKPNATGRA